MGENNIMQNKKVLFVLMPENYKDEEFYEPYNILKNKNKFTNEELVKNAQKIFDVKKVYKFYDDLVASMIYR